MYYVNQDQIERRLNAIPHIAEGMREAAAAWKPTVACGFIQERALHLAIEVVTDVGSYLIDGFIMRDASSYEDIMDIIHEEKVMSKPVYDAFIELVRLRRPLVQEYYDWDRFALHPLTESLPGLLETFASEVRGYLEREL
ncbi:DUF86 domain-containing protein [Paenibacillus sp. F411]|uniref:DUF86 domain-containing protein n=1 Tax=Paenibacillus algicola TaxID=2565926 RepID=A0A4P8XP30_9BACL|nr:MULTISPECIES: HepT-like ribonuclease domain-containing protein [Paenibacillus]MBO2942542.1 DUF86 domain-containing protein [Paenibacillus sp. F411]QCT03520.1 protein of unknown function DUF86 [Paenibacillus algicola]